MLLPTTKAEIKKLNGIKPDIILVTGDTYISFHRTFSYCWNNFILGSRRDY